MSRTVIALQLIPTDHNAQAVGNVIWKECIIQFADDQAPTASAVHTSDCVTEGFYNPADENSDPFQAV